MLIAQVGPSSHTVAVRVLIMILHVLPSQGEELQVRRTFVGLWGVSLYLNNHPPKETKRGRKRERLVWSHHIASCQKWIACLLQATNSCSLLGP
ncbi:unnamed protein product [Prunus brigantina]